MGRMIYTIMILAATSVVFLGCSRSSQMGVRNDMFEGRRALEQGDYAKAEQDFARAGQAQRNPQGYALAATAAYKAGDLHNAERFVNEGLALDSNSPAYMRLLAYRALILLREGRQQEGMQALNMYLGYRNYYPMPNYNEIRRMENTGRIDLARLERLMDSEVRRYESDFAQYYGEGTGYFAERYGPPVVRTVPQ